MKSAPSWMLKRQSMPATLLPRKRNIGRRYSQGGIDAASLSIFIPMVELLVHFEEIGRAQV